MERNVIFHRYKMTYDLLELTRGQKSQGLEIIVIITRPIHQNKCTSAKYNTHRKFEIGEIKTNQIIETNEI